MRIELIGLGLGVSGLLGLGGCGTYQELSSGAATVTATTTRPAGDCKSLGPLTGKGGGAMGAYVANEELIQYAINDLRNQASERGATHVVYSAPAMGGGEGGTSSAMVIGEALSCRPGERPPTPATAIASASRGGCEFDSQCKGDRICVDRQCVAP